LEGPAEAIVAGDPSLLRQLIANLVDNALKFTERGGIVVRLETDLASATIMVEDTGPGIDEKLADRLFDRFYRSDLSHSRTVEGTGLGLAIVRSIARVHNGVVGAKARPGGGAVFVVTLPLLPMADESSSNPHDRP
jgi:signal transduction histidine kinase